MSLSLSHPLRPPQVQAPFGCWPLGPWDKPGQRLLPLSAGIQHVSPQRKSKLGQRPERGCSPGALGLWLPHRPGGGSGGGGSQEIGSQHTPVFISGRLKM